MVLSLGTQARLSITSLSQLLFREPTLPVRLLWLHANDQEKTSAPTPQTLTKERHILMKPAKADLDEYKCGVRVRKGLIIQRFHRIAGFDQCWSSSEALTEPLNPRTDKPHSPYATPTPKKAAV